MSLWVRSPLNINEVANLVRSSFTKIKEHNKGVKYKTPKFLTSLKDNQIKVAKLKSNQKQKMILVRIPSESNWTLVKKNVANFYLHNFNYKAKGGLYSLLKDKGWALGVNGNITYRPDHSVLSIVVNLTDQGIEHYEDVLWDIKDYLDFLSTQKPSQGQYDFYRKIINYKSSLEPVPDSIYNYYNAVLVSKFISFKDLIAKMPKVFDQNAYQKFINQFNFNQSAVVIVGNDPKNGKAIKN